MKPCHHCGGTGFMPGSADLEIETVALSLRAACEASGKRVSGEGRVDEATAAWLVGREPGTLRNWRSLHRPIPFQKRAGRVSYLLVDIARWTLESGDGDQI